MSAFEDRIKNLSPQQLALLALDLKNRLEKTNSGSAESLAVVGIGCRLPGATGPDEFWSNLRDGKDSISEVPVGRWNVDEYFNPDPMAPGRMVTRYGGFVENIEQFDHDFFGISKREADTMDPQQRLLLEVAWQTLENSNISPEDLKGSQTGVFVGICNSDFFVRQTSGDIEDLDMYVSTGTAHSVASGRLSYILGLQGPAISVDTACSSSLVAVHLACQSLRLGECSMAIAGGVNLILLPEITVSLSQANMLSPDGRCKAFDQSANGFVRGEGCGLVALKRLSDAQKDGNQIHAVILGSASNQDGRSHGLTAPNGPAQEAVIQAALGNANVKPDEVTLIEAHGTGTSLGDPIEARALANVFGKRSPQQDPLLVGSAKTNIGHAESAAGIAGLIKLILSVRHREIPQSLHFQELNPHIEWADVPIAVADRLQSWKPSDERCVGGVSSFGFSGSNAHVVVASAPNFEPEPKGAENDLKLRILPLSARTDSALLELCRRFSDRVGEISDSELSQLCRVAAIGRSHFAHRAGLAALSPRQVANDLKSIADNDIVDRAHVGRLDPKSSGQVAFLFPGQGSQYSGMGRDLYESNAVFREVINQCDEYVRLNSDLSLLKAVLPGGPGDEKLIDQTGLTQVAIFAVEYAMAEMWRSWGVRPALVIGHSIGEYAAACVAGVFDLQDALKLVLERGRLTGSLPADGMMAAVFADESRVLEAIKSVENKVSIAAVNAPGNTVLSGDKKSVEKVLANLESEGINSRPLKISNAFHSPAIDPVLDEFESIVASVTLRTPAISVVSNVTGDIAEPNLLQTPSYWRRHLREPVRFMGAVESAVAAGQRTFLEVGTHPVLTPLAMSCVAGDAVTWISTLQRGEDDCEQVRGAVGRLYATGVPLNWRNYTSDDAGLRISLPNYPFQRVRCWPDERVTGAKIGARSSERGMGLVVHQLHSPDLSDHVYESRISQSKPDYLSDHRVFDQTIMPSPVYIELAAGAACAVAQAGKSSGIAIGAFAVHEALILPDEGDSVLQTILRRSTGGNFRFEIYAADASDAQYQWRKYATGSVSAQNDLLLAESKQSVEELRGRMQYAEAGDALYERLASLGLHFGRRFRCLKNIWRGENEALGELALPDDILDRSGHFSMHPALLDGCFHLLDAVAPGDESGDPFLLIGIEQILIVGQMPDKVWAHARPRETQSKEIFAADLSLYGEKEGLLARIDGIELKRAAIRQFAATRQTAAEELCYAVRWHENICRRERTVIASELTPASLRSDLTTESGELAERHELAEYEESLEQLEERSAHYVRVALASMGWTPAVGDTTSVDLLRTSLGVDDRHERLFKRMLAMLVEDGFLEKRDGDAIEVVVVPILDESPVEIKADDRPDSRCAAELVLLDRCGTELANVLQGRTDPMGLLFPKGEFASVEALYREAPYAKSCNTLLASSIRKFFEHVQAGTTLRILEIGAGTGGTTDAALKACDPERTEYVFTDISPLFLERAREKYADVAFMDFSLFDVEQPASAQGLDFGKFDLIIAANVLHATADLEAVIRNVAELLMPGGCLLAIEGTRPTRWVDLTFGFTEGWWKFSDESLRPQHALLKAEDWISLLSKCEFESTTLLDSGYAMPSQEVFFARVNKPYESATSNGQRWLVVGNDNEYSRGICEGLRDVGATVQLEEEAGAIAAAKAEFCGVVIAVEQRSLAGVDLVADVVLSQTMLVSQIMRSIVNAGRKSKLWIATRGAQLLHPDDTGDASSAALWGLGRVIALEHPDHWGGLIDADDRAGAGAAGRQVVSELLAEDEEDQVGIRNGSRFVPRLERAGQPDDADLSLHQDATYLITGGLGGLGLQLGEWLARNGAGQIALMSRRDFPARSSWSDGEFSEEQQTLIATIKRMEEAGSKVVVLKGNVSNRDFVQRIFGEFADNGAPIRGVLHCAVEMSECPVADMNEDLLTSMFDAKIRGTMLLDEVSRVSDTDFFVLFSSTTALLGVAGLGHYAAANQFMDAIASERREAGYSALTINWGTWEIMRVASDDDKRRFSDAGMHRLTVRSALDALQRAIVSGRSSTVIADVDWSALKSIYEARRSRPFLANVSTVKAGAVDQSSAVPDVDSFVDKLTSLPQSKRRDPLIQHIEDIVGHVLGGASSVSPERGFFDMGMDSLMAVELKSRLEKSLGCELPSTLTFNYPTVEAVADYLLVELFDSDDLQVQQELPNSSGGVAEGETISTDSMTDAELEERLADKLRSLGLQ